jgi:hypothetical protein
MRRIVCVLVAGVALVGVVAYMASASGQAEGEAALIFGVTIPPGYRDWRLISTQINRSFRPVTPGPAPQRRGDGSPCSVLASDGCRLCRRPANRAFRERSSKPLVNLFQRLTTSRRRLASQKVSTSRLKGQVILLEDARIQQI